MELSVALRRSAAALSTLLTLIACSSDEAAPANRNWDIGTNDCTLSSAPSGATWSACAVHWDETERTATVSLTSTATPATLVFRTNDSASTASSASALAMMLIPAPGVPPQPFSGSLAVTLNTLGSRSLTFAARLENVTNTTTSEPVTGSIALQAGDYTPIDNGAGKPGNSGLDGGTANCTASAEPLRNQAATLADSSENPDAPEADFICPGNGGTAENPAQKHPDCGAKYCSTDSYTCCDLQGHPELSCPSGSYCTSDGRCAASADCAAPPGLLSSCTSQQECAARNPYLRCDNGSCKVADDNPCAETSWCFAGSTCSFGSATRTGLVCGHAITPPTPPSSPYPCMCAYGGTTNVYTQTCPTGTIACNDPAKSCCPATTPYFINGNCYADPSPACEANEGQCPIRCGN